MKTFPRRPRPLAVSALFLIALQLPQLAFAQWAGSGTTQNPYTLSDGFSASIPTGTTTSVTYIQNGGAATGSSSYFAYSSSSSVGSSARYTLNGGTFSLTGSLTLATEGTPTDAWFTQNGGSASVDALYLESSGSRYVLTGGTLTAKRVNFEAVGSPGLFSLQGGVLVTSNLGTTAGPYVGRLSFDGGTLKADASVASPGTGWINSGFTGIVVATGGAFIDTNGTNRDIYAALPHDSGLGATLDGGLTKLGAGTLNLYNTLSYTGPTTVEAGTLQLNSSSSGILTGGGRLVVNGGSFALGGANESIGSLSGTGGTVNLNGKNLTLNQTVASVYAGSITSAGTLTKAGSATLTLSGASSFSGGAIVNAGLIEFSAVNNFGAGNITLNGGGLRWASGSTTDVSARLSAFGGSGGVFDTNGNTPTLASPLTGTGGFTKIGAGTLKLTGASTYSGPTTVTEGFVEFSAANNFGASNVTLNGGGLRWAAGTSTDISARLTAYGASGATFDTNGNNITLATPHSGGGITKIGAGILTLNSANTFTGGTTVSAGTLKLDFGGGIGAIRGALTIGAGTTVETSAIDAFGYLTGTKVDSVVINGGTLNNTAAGNCGWGVAYTLSNGALLTSNGGVSSASSPSDFAFGGPTGGNTSVNVTNGVNTIAGHVDLRGDNGNASGVNFTVASGATLNVTAGFSSNDGGVVGPVNITKLGAGTMTLAGASTFSGNTAINAGVLQAGNASAFGSGTISFGGGTLQYGTGISTDFSARFSTAASQQYRIDTNSQNVSFATVLTSSGGTFTKIGAGTLTLSGANTYTGGTTVTAGTLKLNFSGGIGTIRGALTIGAGATVETSGIDALGFSTGAKVDSIAIDGGTLNNTAAGNNGWGIAYTLSNGALLTSNGGVSSTSAPSKFAFGGLAGANTSVNVTAGTNTIAGSVDLRNDVSGQNPNSNFTVATGATLNVTAGIFNSGEPVRLIKLGGGTMTLTGANTYTGGTTLSAGTLRIGNGGTSGSLTGDIIDNSSLIFSRSDASTYAGVISGAGAFEKSGAGALTLTGANTYTGGTTLNAGTLNLIGTGYVANTAYVVNGGTLDIGYGFTMSSLSGGGGTVVVSRGGTFTLNQSSSTTYGGAIASTVTNGDPVYFVKTGAGTLTLTGASVNAPRISIAAGALVLDGGALTPAGVFAVGAGAGSSTSLMIRNGGALNAVSSNVGTSSNNNSVTVTGAGSVWNAGGLSVGEFGSGNSLLIQSGGVVSLAGVSFIGSQAGDANNSVTVDGAGSKLTTSSNLTIGRAGSGTLTIQNGGLVSGTSLFVGSLSGGAGTLNIGGFNLSSATGAGTLSASSVVFGAGTGAINFNQNDATTFSAAISGGGSVNQRGTGTTTLTGANAYSGGTTISAGTLQIGDGGTTGSLTGNITDNATLVLNRSNNIDFGGVISGTGSLTKLGSGAATLTGANTYSGGTTISAGILAFGNPGAIGTGRFYVNVGATLDTAGYGFDLTRAQGDGGSGTITGTGTFAYVSAADLELRDIFAGVASLVKEGSGTLTLTADSTLTGPTTVGAGALLVNGSLSGSPVTVRGGATLGGSGDLGALATLESGAYLAPGNSPGTLTFAGGLTLYDGGFLDFQLGLSASDLIRVSGGVLTGPASGHLTLNLVDVGGFGEGSYTLFDYAGATLAGFDASDFTIGSAPGGYDYAFATEGGALKLVVTVPEPGVAALVTLGVFFLPRRRRRCRV